MSSTSPAPGSDNKPQPVEVRLSRLSDRRLLFHANELVAEFVRRRLSLDANGRWSLYRAIGLLEGDDLVGGVVFHDYHPRARDIEISAAFDNPAWCSLPALRGILYYPLHTLKLERCTARVAEGNSRARDFLVRFGFREEGRLRRAAGDGEQDMMIYGVLREELRFTGYPRRGSN
jgi:RimJ/RimL family protein N-acetyltransferase